MVEPSVGLLRMNAMGRQGTHLIYAADITVGSDEREEKESMFARFVCATARCLRSTRVPHFLSPFGARQRGLLWGPLTQLDPCVGMMKGGPGMSGFVPGPCFHQLGRLSGCRQAGRMVSVSASQSMTLFCRSDSTPILMATIVEVPRSTLHACSSPRRMASRKLPM